MRTWLLTTIAMIAFAANSLLCRQALGSGDIDAASFTALRLATGAAALALLAARRGGPRGGNWASAAALFLYAAPFSFAYLSLSAGTGALLLFGAVQATMIARGLRAGERPHRREWAGLVIALGGLVLLVLPGVRAPSPAGSALMLTAGVAWGVYSLRGRGAARPVATTAGNFLRASLPGAALALAFADRISITPRGALLATASGAAASAFGYVVWYAALPRLTAARAATVQLSVPVIAAAGGVALLGERVTPRLVVCGALILGGVALALRGPDAR